MNTNKAQTIICHPQTGRLYISAHRYKDAAAAITGPNRSDFEPVTQDQAPDLAEMFKGLPSHPGEHDTIAPPWTKVYLKGTASKGPARTFGRLLSPDEIREEIRRTARTHAAGQIDRILVLTKASADQATQTWYIETKKERTK